MDKLKFFISLIVTISLVYFLNHPIPVEVQIPPLGKVLNPFTGFWKNAENVSAKNADIIETLNILEVTAPVKVMYDDKLVPHIFAQNQTDAQMVLGYIEAKNRLWQMDFSTRATSGRLSEVLGEMTINYDKGKRRKGLLFAAENTLKTWKANPESYAMVEAYSKGVNAYINQLSTADYPVEYKILDFEPEPWSPLKSAIFLKAMAETLSSGEMDLESTNALNTFGRATFDFIYPERSSKESPIIPKSKTWDFEPISVLEKTAEPSIGAIFHEPFEKPHKGIGSNNWTVSGSKTASGNPILCNDPHLNLTLPAIWFEVQIHTPETNVYGVSLPGSPGVTIGFNENIAWGFTNVGHDVMDWYRIKWANAEKTKYHFDGKILDAEIKIETIKVKGQPDVLDTVRYTHWGPVTYESKDNPYQDLAMRWMAHDGKGNELEAFKGINYAKNFEEYFEGLRTFDNPAQNIAFASRDGDIALKVQGKFPLKTKEQGRFVQDGSTSASAWKGFIPFEQTPFAKNPEEGFIGSANQFSADTTYPYYYNGGFEDFRGRTLNRKLAAMENITIQDMMDLQTNNFSIKAQEALPLLLGYLENENLNTEEKELVDILKNWDYNYDKNKTAPIIFDNWYSAFYKKTWDEIYALDKDDFPILYPESWRTVELLDKTPDHDLFDFQETTEKETAKDIVLMSFKAMVKKSKDWKKNGKYISWETYRNVRLPHMVKSFNGFQSDYISAGGHGNVLNALTSRRGGAFGPSWRMIVELGDEMKAYGVYPAGQSGNPGSPYYDSMVDTWASGKYYELLFLKNKDEKSDRILFSQEFK